MGQPPRDFGDPMHKLLARDAMPTMQDLQTPDGCRRAREARNELLRLFLEAKKARKLHELHISVRGAIEAIKAANGGKLPPAKSGRHEVDRSRDLALAIAVALAGGGIREMVSVAKAAGVSFETARAAYYRLRNTTAMRAELSRRQISADRLSADQVRADWYKDWRSAVAAIPRPKSKSRAPRVAD